MTFPKQPSRACTRFNTMLVAALLAGLGAAPALAGQETHSIHTEVLNPGFGTQDFDSFDLPRFNDQGGTLALDSVDITYDLLVDIRYDVNGNPTDEFVSGTEYHFTFQWEALGNDGPLLPHNIALHSGNFFVGYDADPQEEPGVHFFNGVGIGNAETITDPGFLSTVTGTSPISLQSLFTVSFATEMEPPTGTWDPDLYEPSLDRLYVDMNVTYNYSTIPAPGALAVAALGLPVFTRRRRRHS